MFTTHTKKRRWLAVLLVLAMMIGMLPMNATDAYATDTSTLQIPVTVTVENTHPEGITINLFDYWLDAQGSQDDNNPEDYQNLGINADHALKFGKNMGTVTPKEAEYPVENKAAIESALKEGNINAWTNGARPMAGIVASTLDADGYPVLNASLGSEPLGYLFNTTSVDGKEAYLNVGGLLQQHQDGYFYYNSQENFAAFDSEKNLFTLYNQGGVKAKGASPHGQFFPFNTAENVFIEPEVDSINSVINHYFGMHMTTSFQQTPGGMSPSDKDDPVTFSFSGDDDVWVYIDDVLVADLGGIHDACSVEIDFSTGEIYVFKDKPGGNRGEGYYDEGETLYNADSDDAAPTLKEMYEAAGKAGSVEWKDETFADESYHTFDFFYLERGNTDSNMRMRHNIQTVPESELFKIDQDGEPVEEAKYALYETDKDYKVSDGADPIATGTTDTKGVFIFKNTDGETLPLNDLEAEGHYLLVEETVPKGYRSGTKPIELYVKPASNGNKKLLLSANAWDTGAYAMPMVRVSATTDGNGFIQNQDGNNYDARNGGLIVAAIFKGENVEYGQEDLNGLNLVYGDPVNGWKMAEGDSAAEQLQAVAQSMAASNEPGIYAFSLDSSGAYSADIEHLPGDINDYSWMVNDKNNGGDTKPAQFMGAYFFVEGAKSISDIEKTDANKIHLLNSDGFIRDFSMRLYAPNIENRLLVQKVDENGAPITAQATFTLYKKGVDGTEIEVKNYTTGNYPLGDETQLQGAVAITTGLAAGNYVLRETQAPTGYTASTDDIVFVVDSSGVHVDAGESDDDISVKLGVGKIVKSMVQFATDDGIDATLHDITATLQTAKNYDTSGTTLWTEQGQSMNLSYGATETVLEYGPASTDGPVYLTYDSGWGRLNIKQNLNDADGTPSPEPKQRLNSDQSLNNLFSGTTMVVVANQKTATPEGTLDGEKNLQVTKQVTGGEWPEGTTFQFEIMSESPNAPMPAATTITIGKPADGSNRNSAAFGDITFGQPGTYVYHIREVAQTDGDVIYDRHTMTVTVTVEQNFDIRVQTEGSSVFTNRLVDDRPPIDPGDPDDPDTPSLNKDDHFLYIEGYPEDYRTGEYSDNEDLWPVKPQGNITRAEVATIFYRLLKDEVREEIETDVNSFPDVNADDWFNVTVSSLANMNAISGYEDGTFRPNEPITRAELAAMAERFYEAFDAEYEEGTFLDVEGDEWYADAIAAAKELGILGGYPDGTVRPNNNITRAETCAIVNRVLERRPHDEHLGDVDDMRTWPDNLPGAWYYADMQEATNGHYYEWIDIDGVDFEEWTEVDKDYDWTKR